VQMLDAKPLQIGLVLPQQGYDFLALHMGNIVDSSFSFHGHEALSQEALRIDVDLELELALRLRRRRQPVPQIAREIERAWRLDEKPEAIAAAHQSERRFRRPEHADFFLARRRAGQPAREGFGVVLVAARDNEARETTERRI